MKTKGANTSMKLDSGFFMFPFDEKLLGGN